jgi:hypothetical protein
LFAQHYANSVGRDRSGNIKSAAKEWEAAEFESRSGGGTFGITLSAAGETDRGARVIRGYAALIDPAAVGINSIVFVRVTLDRQDTGNVKTDIPLATIRRTTELPF